jgi:hypothetical protein
MSTQSKPASADDFEWQYSESDERPVSKQLVGSSSDLSSNPNTGTSMYLYSL